MRNTIWILTYSYRERYEREDVIPQLLAVIRKLDVQMPVIVDVGCSDAECTAYMKNELANKFSTHSYVVGVDVEKSVAEEAKRNVDDFVIASAFSLPFNNSVDVAICQNLAANFMWSDRCNLFAEMLRVLTRHGAVISNARSYGQPDREAAESVYSADLPSFIADMERSWNLLPMTEKTKIIAIICIRKIITWLIEPIYRKQKHNEQNRKAIERLLKTLGYE